MGLDALAKANLGVGKSHSSGLEAIRLYREQKLEELRDYCLQDVKLTKDLYDLVKKQRYLIIPDRDTGTNKKVMFDLPEFIFPSTLF